MAGNIVPRTDGGSNLGTADKEFNVIYAKSFGGTIASQVVTTNSPTFTGTPAAPTAAAGTDTTQIATTAFANAAASAAASSAVSTHNLANDAHSATIAAAVNTHNAATDAHSTEFAKYLPLSGGEMSGQFITRSVDSNMLSIIGGNGIGHGAGLNLKGKDNLGSFNLYATATDGTITSSLAGFPDGTLTWAGNPVATTNKLSMPSDTVIDIAVTTDGAGQNYTAPTDGWVRFYGQCTASPCYMILSTLTMTSQVAHGIVNNWTDIFIPVKAGDVVTLRFSNISQTNSCFKFVSAKSAT